MSFGHPLELHAVDQRDAYVAANGDIACHIWAEYHDCVNPSWGIPTWFLHLIDCEVLLSLRRPLHVNEARSAQENRIIFHRRRWWWRLGHEGS